MYQTLVIIDGILSVTNTSRLIHGPGHGTLKTLNRAQMSRSVKETSYGGTMTAPFPSSLSHSLNELNFSTGPVGPRTWGLGSR